MGDVRKMNKEGGLNLSELATTMSELERVSVKILPIIKKTLRIKKMCESLQDSAKAEQDLHQKMQTFKLLDFNLLRNHWELAF